MKQAVRTEPEDRYGEIARWIQTKALRMGDDKEFAPLFAQSMDRIRDAGLDFYALSFYLFESDAADDALHYTFFKGEVGWLQASVTEEMAEYQVRAHKEAHSWQDAQSEPPVAYLYVPTTMGTVTIAAERHQSFAAAEQAILETLAVALEMLVVRHRDLVAYNVANEAYQQIRARLITSNPDLMALHDGSFDLSGETTDEVAQLILQFITARLGLDRGGIFLREDEVLRGFWGMDEQGRPEPIPDTVFPLYPERDEELTHTALIARGEEQVYLTQDLGAEGGVTIERDYGANIAVPMRVGERIIGVLAADNFTSKRPIPYDQAQALMVLANMGAAAMERADLYQDLRQFNEELEQRVGERTARLAQTNGQLQDEIAERKRVEEELQVLLREKDLLFKEIHHRVKNNLQTISSLLSLQIHYLQDPEALSALEASRGRIEAMGRIHQQLYQTEDWARVDFEAFLRELVEDLVDTYRVGSIDLEIDSEAVYLDVDKSIHCCLLLNELVANTLKHAFPSGGPGVVRVVLKALAEGRVLLEVADNGVGFPAGLDFRQTDSLGLQIAVSLVKNLEGEIDMSREGGTAFTIEFPAEN